jgi:protein-disulfide isomerase
MLSQILITSSPRHVFLRALCVFIALCAFTPAVFAQNASIPVETLMVEGALPDIWEGPASAPVTIIEYASMTCPHCARFHATTYPVLKSKYIDAGKVRFTLREFPLDPLATAGFMVARCIGTPKRNAMIELLFAQQANWAFTDKPLQGLQTLVKQAGMNEESLETCLKDQTLYDNVNKVRDRASEKFSVNATPTFFVNGQRVSGEISPEELDKLLQPMLNK